jgi:hypothetical protein
VFNFEHRCWQMRDGTFAELDFHQMADLRVYTLVQLSDTYAQYFGAKKFGGASALLRAPSPLFQIGFAAFVPNAAERQKPRRALCGPASRSLISAGLLTARGEGRAVARM